MNHLFLEQTYQENGYFEYNCTENFAHLVHSEEDPWLEKGYQPGDFVVYNQVGTIEGNQASLDHGQFMPYNDLEEGKYSRLHSNTTDETDAVLSYQDPRKDMPLYAIPAYDKKKGETEDNNADYHFGMEMTASFTQTSDGVDAWGHDIIFEFAGDDDMWFYVDGVRVLDLDGTHAARVGKINFRTGAITGSGINNTNNTLLKVFTASYKAQYPDWTQNALDEWLEGIFKKDNKGNLTSVFQDYSTHTMHMFYMERGAGASNLHMRFNLAAVKPGTVQLGKTLSGVDTNDTVNAEFPYQIWYTTEENPDSWQQLADPGAVKYLGSSRNVRYNASYSVRGAETPYAHVFFLKPAQTAEITMPNGTLTYKIVECGISGDLYDVVKANDEVLTGTANGQRYDYGIAPASLAERQTVTYDNHIRDGALRTLTFTKRLFDVEGHPIAHGNDGTVFDFRLYLGGESDAVPAAANMQAYCVKDQSGHYCRWDRDAGTFASLGKTEYDQLSAAEKEAATFHSSINGAISYIPIDYTVEVRHLLIGTAYRIVERENEVPEGYSWKGYALNGSTLEVSQEEGISGKIPENPSEPDPAAEIQNYKGWGLTVEKIWSDADFMQSHDPIYFAVCTEDENGNLTLLPDTVRQMTGSSASLYWYFDRLRNDADFAHHVIREVIITNQNPEVDAHGYVRDPGNVSLIAEGGVLHIKAVSSYSRTEHPYTYTAHYTQGQLDTDQDNIRVDTVTNARPGIRIVKEDWDGHPLAGAVFTLKDSEGRDIGQESYTSDESGLVTIAYLPKGTFTLTEIQAPAGYAGLADAITIVEGNNGNNENGLEVSGSEADRGAYSLTEATHGSEPVITIKNRPFTLKAVKTDASSGNPLPGVHFALYRQVKGTDGQLIRDYYPMEGYEDLVTDAEGTIPKLTEALPAGTYYLHETRALPQYMPIEEDVCFTISPVGVVTLYNDNGLADRDLEKGIPEGADGTIQYTLTVKNAEAWQKIKIQKVDIGNISSVLPDAGFDLYKTNDGTREESALYTGLTSGEDGFLRYEKEGTKTDVLNLPVGVYHLIETAAPAGYTGKTDPVIITVTASNVTYDEGTTLSQSGSGRTYDASSKTYTLKVSNSAGVELPSTGGPGTQTIYLLGSLFLGLAYAILRMSTGDGSH